MDQAKVIAVRSEFETLLDERDVNKARSNKAQTAISAVTSWNNAVAGLLNLADEDESIDTALFPPPIEDEEFLGWLKGVATASGSTETSTKLTELQKRLTTWIQVADDLEIPEDEQDTINQLLKRYGSSGSGSSAPRRAGGEGMSLTEKSRHLNGVPVINITRNGESLAPIKAGERQNEGDWVSARYEMKKRVDRVCADEGLDAKSVWTAFTPKIAHVRDGLLAVDAGEAAGFDEEFVEETTGLTFHITY
jgi:hypothetical protein